MFTRNDWDGYWIASADEDLTTVVWDGVTPIVSVLEISEAGRYNHRHEDFLTVVNPNDFRYSAREGRGAEGQLRHKHEWARDDEGDRAMTVYLQFTDIALLHAYDTLTTYSAWLVERPQFFPPTYPDNPFVSAKKIEPEFVEREWGNGNKYEAAQNVNYPYTPPEIIGGKQNIRIPMKVELTFRVNTPGNGYMDLNDEYAKGLREAMK